MSASNTRMSYNVSIQYTYVTQCQHPIHLCDIMSASSTLMSHNVSIQYNYVIQCQHPIHFCHTMPTSNTLMSYIYNVSIQYTYAIQCQHPLHQCHKMPASNTPMSYNVSLQSVIHHRDWNCLCVQSFSYLDRISLLENSSLFYHSEVSISALRVLLFL